MDVNPRIDWSSQVRRISPMLATDDMEATVRFYADVLGFRATLMSAEYAVVERDGQTIHLMPAASDEVMHCMRRHTEIYVEVTGIVALWRHVESMRARYTIRDLFERDYGMTEFHIVDPHGCLVFVGQPTTELAKERAGDEGLLSQRRISTVPQEKDPTA